MLPEEVTKLIGKLEEIVVMEVEKGAIRRFADAVDDPNPLYRDDEYASNSRYGSIIAPPGFFGWPTKSVKEEAPSSGVTGELIPKRLIDALVKAGYTRVIDGGIDYEFFKPVRAGDILTASLKVTSVSERKSTAFAVFETTFTNQNGDLVAKVRQIGIF